MPSSCAAPLFPGYLAGTADLTTDYDDKNELDFNRRLVAQFEIPNDASFWGKGLSRVGDDELYPSDDSIRDLCAMIDVGLGVGPAPEALGRFVASWAALEQSLVSRAQQYKDRILTFGQALKVLRRGGQISDERFTDLDELRQIRNRAMHGQDIPPDNILLRAAERIEAIRHEMREGFSQSKGTHHT